MPIVTLFVLFGAVVYYVGYIFPATANLFRKFNIDLPPMTKATLIMSDFLVENIVMILIGTIVPIIVAIKFFSSEKGRFILDKYVWQVPVLGQLLHKMSI